MDFYDVLFAKYLDKEGGGSSVDVESLSVTENGTYQEEGKAYSPVTVNVQTNYTATITGTGSTTGETYAYAIYNGTTYLDSSQTFQYKAGDTVEFHVFTSLGESYQSSVVVDGSTVFTKENGVEGVYEYTLPSNDISIFFHQSQAQVTFPTVQITSNGVKDVKAYVRADVNVPSDVSLRKITLVNNRASGTATQKKMTLETVEITNGELHTIDKAVSGGATKEYYIPFGYATSSTQHIIFRSASSGTEPVFTGTGFSTVGHYVSSTIRYSIVGIASTETGDVSITIT